MPRLCVYEHTAAETRQTQKGRRFVNDDNTGSDRKDDFSGIKEASLEAIKRCWHWWPHFCFTQHESNELEPPRVERMNAWRLRIDWGFIWPLFCGGLTIKNNVWFIALSAKLPSDTSFHCNPGQVKTPKHKQNHIPASSDTPSNATFLLWFQTSLLCNYSYITYLDRGVTMITSAM